jgi:hypothetical protein
VRRRRVDGESAVWSFLLDGGGGEAECVAARLFLVDRGGEWIARLCPDGGSELALCLW